jgi:YHS domain-containing protein
MSFLRLIYYAFLAYLVYAVVKFLRNATRRPEPPRNKAQLSGVMVKDEACQTYIPKEESLREMVDGEEKFFCSKDCRQKFLAERRKDS